MNALPELPKPAVELHGKHRNGKMSAESMRLYTDELMREYGDARASHARKQALEECVSELRGMKANNKTAQSAINLCAETLEELK